MDDEVVPLAGLSEADRRALVDLRSRKDLISGQMDDPDLPAHVRGRLVTEFRQYCALIWQIERAADVSTNEYTIVDQLRDRRASRLAELAKNVEK